MNVDEKRMMLVCVCVSLCVYVYELYDINATGNYRQGGCLKERRIVTAVVVEVALMFCLFLLDPTRR